MNILQVKKREFIKDLLFPPWNYVLGDVAKDLSNNRLIRLNIKMSLEYLLGRAKMKMKFLNLGIELQLPFFSLIQTGCDMTSGLSSHCFFW